MPYIDAKITLPLNVAQKEELKSKFGNIILTLRKTEQYLMVGIDDNYDLWFAGKKLEKGAYVSVSAFGSLNPQDCNKFTDQVCHHLEKMFGIPKDAVYVTYHSVSDWGWNGSNL